jgi:hypothetical protein
MKAGRLRPRMTNCADEASRWQNQRRIRFADFFTTMGFLRKEKDGYRTVEGMKKNLVGRSAA